MTKEDLLTPQVIGRLGELATEMELLKRGWSVGNYNASTKNAAAYDLFASKGNRRIGIRVKSYKGYKGNSKRSGEGVQYTAKSHGSVFHNLDENDTGDFVVIVRICPGEAEDFYILPTAIVDKEIKESNKKFHEHSKKDGTTRKKPITEPLTLAVNRQSGHRIRGTVKSGQSITTNGIFLIADHHKSKTGTHTLSTLDGNWFLTITPPW